MSTFGLLPTRDRTDAGLAEAQERGRSVRTAALESAERYAHDLLDIAMAAPE